MERRRKSSTVGWRGKGSRKSSVGWRARSRKGSVGWRGAARVEKNREE